MYTRSIHDSVLTLSASGWTYDNVFVLYDYETESLWYPMSHQEASGRTLVCISGHFADQKLPSVPSSLTTWSKWKSSHPASKFLRR